MTFEDQPDESYKVYLSSAKTYVLEDIPTRLENEDPTLTGAEIAAYYAYSAVMAMEEEGREYNESLAMQPLFKDEAAITEYKWPDERFMTKH